MWLELAACFVVRASNHRALQLFLAVGPIIWYRHCARPLLPHMLVIPYVHTSKVRGTRLLGPALAGDSMNLNCMRGQRASIVIMELRGSF